MCLYCVHICWWVEMQIDMLCRVCPPWQLSGMTGYVVSAHRMLLFFFLVFSTFVTLDYFQGHNLLFSGYVWWRCFLCGRSAEKWRLSVCRPYMFTLATDISLFRIVWYFEAFVFALVSGSLNTSVLSRTTWPEPLLLTVIKISVYSYNTHTYPRLNPACRAQSAISLQEPGWRHRSTTCFRPSRCLLSAKLEFRPMKTQRTFLPLSFL